MTLIINTTKCLYISSLVQEPLKALVQLKQLSLTVTDHVGDAGPDPRCVIYHKNSCQLEQLKGKVLTKPRRTLSSPAGSAYLQHGVMQQEEEEVSEGMWPLDDQLLLKILDPPLLFQPHLSS